MDDAKQKLRAEITHKVCGKCGENKKTCEYAKKSAAKDGLQTNCKVCVNVIKQEWRENAKK